MQQARTSDPLNFYINDEYILKNPSLHEEESPWKASKIFPLIDTLMPLIDKGEVNLLDVGGGAGVILNLVSAYIEKKYHKKVNKFALDLSPGMLKIQQDVNPDIKLALNKDIRESGLGDKQIDLTLMIDVIEHIPDPKRAFLELKRVSKYVIYKVPVEDNLTSNFVSVVTGGRNRKFAMDNVGHINVFNQRSLRKMIEQYNGSVVKHYYTNFFNYLNNAPSSKSRPTSYKLVSYAGELFFNLSPRLAAFLLCDHIMVLVKCYDP